jgi:hypothetical protein
LIVALSDLLAACAVFAILMPYAGRPTSRGGA